MDRFLFVGDNLALDFINTRVRTRGHERDLLEGPADFERWWAEAAEHYDGFEPLDGAATDAELLRLREFREMLRESFALAVQRGDFDASLIASLNRELSRAHPEIMRCGSHDALVFRATEPRERAVVAIALAAARLVTEGQVERLHACEGCILFFYDRTKSGTRHWCSTRCFDRARAQQRRAGTTTRLQDPSFRDAS